MIPLPISSQLSASFKDNRKLLAERAIFGNERKTKEFYESVDPRPEKEVILFQDQSSED
jgi:hypothetical protein